MNMKLIMGIFDFGKPNIGKLKAKKYEQGASKERVGAYLRLWLMCACGVGFAMCAGDVIGGDREVATAALGNEIQTKIEVINAKNEGMTCNFRTRRVIRGDETFVIVIHERPWKSSDHLSYYVKFERKWGKIRIEEWGNKGLRISSERNGGVWQSSWTPNKDGSISIEDMPKNVQIEFCNEKERDETLNLLRELFDLMTRANSER